MNSRTGRQFLSSNAQDFIEERHDWFRRRAKTSFLSSNAQDFIEDPQRHYQSFLPAPFLSSNAQDFIEEGKAAPSDPIFRPIPEQ